MMNNPLTQHEPTPEFAARLESQLVTELRRRNREGHAPWWAAWPAARLAVAAAALVLLAMGAGGAVVAATYEAQNAQLRDQLVATYEQRVALARQRLDLATTEHAAAQRRFEVGLSDTTTVLEKGVDVVGATAQVELLTIDLAEIRASGREPNHELSAPRIAGRDYVGERLRVQLTVPERSVEVARQLIKDNLIRVEIGTMSPESIEVVRNRVIELEASVETLQRKIAVRDLFLTGRVNAPTVQLRGVEIEMEQRIKVLRPQVDQALAAVKRVTQQVEVGLMPSKAAAEAKLRQLELETELSKAELELALVRERIRKEDAPTSP